MTLLVCFSHLRWNFVWQRPQHLLTRAAPRYRVLFVEEPVLRPGARPAIEIAESDGVRIATPVLPDGIAADAMIEAQRRLIRRLLAVEEGSRIFWYYTPMALAFTRELDCDVCVYDNMDELSLFSGASQALIDLEAELLARADVVFTGGASLYAAKRRRHHNIHCFPSSIDFDHFAQARRLRRRREPSDQAAIPRPRLGFFGVVDERMDLQLVERTAALRPEWHLVMIGPVVKIDPATLPRRDNIHWLGGKPYADLPRYLATWDVGFMPFALNDSTRFISPTKTPEFLAAGLPVISTPVTDVVNTYGRKSLVEIARNAREVVQKAEAVIDRPRRNWLAKVDRCLASGSWDRTWASMQALIRDVHAKPASKPAVAARLAAATLE